MDQFDHVRRGLSIVQEILDQNYQDLIEGIVQEGFNENSKEISEILQDKAQKLQALIADKNRIIKALTKALSKRPQRRSDWAEIANYFEKMNQRGKMARADDVEKLVRKLIPPKVIHAQVTDKTEKLDEDLYKCHTFSPFVVDVMTRADGNINKEQRRKSSSGSSTGSSTGSKLDVRPVDDRINELTKTLKRNVELSNQLRNVLQDLLGTIQNYAVPILSSLENLAKDITIADNSDAVQIISDMRITTENDVKGGKKLMSVLSATTENPDGFVRQWSIRDSVELAKGKIVEKLNQTGEMDADQHLNDDLKHLCKQMEISIREVGHTKQELQELQDMLNKYEKIKQARNKNLINRASCSGISSKSHVQFEELQDNQPIPGPSNALDSGIFETSEQQLNKIFEGFDIIRKVCDEESRPEVVQNVEPVPIFEAVDGTLTERIDRLLFAVRRKMSFSKRNREIIPGI